MPFGLQTNILIDNFYLGHSHPSLPEIPFAIAVDNYKRQCESPLPAPSCASDTEKTVGQLLTDNRQG
jgi:hypothetical protein